MALPGFCTILNSRISLILKSFYFVIFFCLALEINGHTVYKSVFIEIMKEAAERVNAPTIFYC